MSPAHPYAARPSAGREDLIRIYRRTIDLAEDAVHLADLPWRLTSPAARTPQRTQLWEDSAGNLLAWAILQFPWHCLDYVVFPSPHAVACEREVFAWSIPLLQAEAGTRSDGLIFTVSVREADTSRRTAIARAGFAPAGRSYIKLVRDLDQPLPAPEPPPGFAIRPLAGDQEVAAYVATHRAAFGSTNMTEDWRSATLLHPQYTPDLDLVAVTPDGTVAGFCVVWITPPLAAHAARPVAQIEPLGVLPDLQRMGLARALLLESLRRAKSHGAHHMEVYAESNNDASRRTYESVGFRPLYEVPFFVQHFGDRT